MGDACIVTAINPKDGGLCPAEGVEAAHRTVGGHGGADLWARDRKLICLSSTETESSNAELARPPDRLLSQVIDSGPEVCYQVLGAHPADNHRELAFTDPLSATLSRAEIYGKGNE